MVGSGNAAFGGVERHVIQLANGLVLAGHAVAVFIGRQCPIDAAHGLVPEAQVHRVPAPDGRSFPAYAGEVARGVARLRPCLVHTHLTYGLAAGVWAGLLTGAPVVHTEHFLVRKSGDSGPRGWMGAILRGRARTLICVSRMVQDGCTVVGGGADKVVIYSGVDPVVPPPQWQPSRRLVYLGRLEPDKHVGVLVDAMGELQVEGYVLDIVGTGSEEQTLRTRAGDLLTLGKVRFHGWQDEVGRFLEGAGALLLPAKEALGYSALEAAAYGVPVVAPAASGAAEVVARTRRGALVQQDGPGAWAEAIRGLAALSATQAVLPDVFDRRHMIADTLRVYQPLWDAIA